MSSQEIKTVTIVGGGTAGWLTASLIAAHSQRTDGEPLTVRLIESPNIPTIGVGEGTWPTMRQTLEKIGVSERDFFKECDASFKQASKFVNWTTGSDAYYHPFSLPEGFSQVNLAKHWLASNKQTDFANSVSVQPALCDHNLAPKLANTPDYAGFVNYAYHLDAGKFVPFLIQHATEKLGVNHVLDDIENVALATNGDIEKVVTAKSGAFTSDLFIDCTGFKALLIGGALKVPFRKCGDTLPVDTALAIQVPYETPESTIKPYTQSTAQSNGWIWDIGLTTRRGVGHVFSSAHTNVESALLELDDYIQASGGKANVEDARTININSGHREKFWVNNCVAVGLSAGFLEPLEASAIVMIELSATMIAEQMPQSRHSMDVVAQRFNDKFLYRWDRIIDFLKLHYLISKRRDSAFWNDVTSPDNSTDSLNGLLEYWRHDAVSKEDFSNADEIFPAASYQYVLYGMDYPAGRPQRGMSAAEQDLAQQYLKSVQQKTASVHANTQDTRQVLGELVS